MYYIGFDIGGTKCAVSLGSASESGVEILNKIKFPTAGKAPAEVMELFAQHASEAVVKAGISMGDIARIGISCGGPLDSKRGIILSPPNLPGWDGIHIKEFFEGRFGVETRLQNDANACAVAEWKWGAGRGTQNMVFVTFGTGFGAGLILDGQLYSGTHDSAGEIGHIRLTSGENDPVGYRKRGSVEGWCSGGGIAQTGAAYVRRELEKGETPLLWERAGEDEANITAKLIGDLADEGDPLSIEIYRKVGEMFGRTCAIIIDLFDPEMIVAGGIFMRSSHLILPEAERVIDVEALAMTRIGTKIVPAGLGEEIGNYAALGIAAM